MKRALALLLLAGGAAAEALLGNDFVFAQLQHEGDWDPYPGQWPALAEGLAQITSLSPWPERRDLRVSSPALFDSPFLVLAGREDPGFSESELARLRDYLGAGGFLFVDHAAAAASGPFAAAVKSLPARLFGDADWKPVPRDHALYRSFFLLSRAAGRRRVTDDVLGLWVGARLVAVYSENDLLGALARDRLGQPLHPCSPDGEMQRLESRKLFTNIVIFGMTGTYKTDAIHQPFLERKARP